MAEAAVGYVAPDWDRAAALERLVQTLAAQGFRFEPWEVAAYVTALRTKPFVLLAGVTGVGKSRLPVLVADATGGVATVLPVRPDWTDPAETMGYTDLGGRFRPGAVLRAARAATGDARFHTLVLDEMNLGRPEHYLAEVLSRVEQRAPAPPGRDGDAPAATSPRRCWPRRSTPATPGGRPSGCRRRWALWARSTWTSRRTRSAARCSTGRSCSSSRPRPGRLADRVGRDRG